MRPRRRHAIRSHRAARSASLGSIFRQILRRTEDLELDCVAAVRSQVPDYGRQRDPAFVTDMRRMIRLVARVWFGTFLSGRLPSRAAFEPISEVARHRVHQGIPIESMLQAWQIGAGVFWKKIVDAAQGDAQVESRILHRISPLAFAVLQKSSEAISRAYLEELGTSARWQGRIQDEFTGLPILRRAVGAQRP